MKKITGITVITFVILFNVYSNPVDTTEAKKVAINFFMQKSDTRLKSFHELEIAKTIVHTYNGHNSYYVFKFKPTGFVIIAADDVRDPIIAWSTNSIFNEYDLPPAYIDWMEQYDWYIDSLITYNVSNDSSIQEWDALKQNNTRLKAYRPYRTGFTLVDTEWGQSNLNDLECGNNYPDFDNGAYNKFCPEEKGDLDCNCGRCAAGCVAVAMAQIMKYWNYPVHNTYQDYDWCHMPPVLDENSTTREIDAVARLIADCGEAVNTAYCSWFLDRSCESSANTKNAINAFINYGYNSNSIAYKKRKNTRNKWQKILREELDNERPVLYRYHGKHAFVCDGYNYDNPYEFHFNWGWRGNNNDGFYDLDEMNPGKYNYSEKRRKHHAIIGIQPGETISCDVEVDICDNTIIYPLSIPNKEFNILYGGKIFNSCNIKIENNEKREYRAYSTIELNPGFETETGAEFSASIVPCPANNCDFYNISTKSKKLKSWNDSKNRKSTSKEQEIRDQYNTEKDLSLKNEDHRQEEIMIYPNPNTGAFTLNIHSNNLAQSKIELYANDGTLLLTKTQLSETMQMEITNEPQGIYFIKLITPTNVLTQKVIYY